METIVLGHLAFILGLDYAQVDTSASFFELGGNSIHAVVLHSRCKNDGVLVSIEQIISSSSSLSELLGQATTLEGFEHLLGSESLARPDFRRFNTGSTLNDGYTGQNNGSMDIDEQFSGHVAAQSIKTAPMTEMQLMFVFGSQKDPETNVISYHEEYPLHHLAAVTRAFQSVITAEPMFKTTFDMESRTMTESPDPLPLYWNEVHANDRDEYEQIVKTHKARVNIMSNIFTSFQTTIFSQEQIFTVSWHVHHALIDGCSKSLLLEKIRRVASGGTSSPGPSFVDWARAHHAYQTENVHFAKQFWEEQAAKYPSPSGTLSLSRPVTDDKTLQDSNESQLLFFKVPYDDLVAAAKKQSITLATLFHGAWALVLSRYLATDVVVFGTVLSGRSSQLDGTYSTVGPLLNTLPFHFKIDESMSCEQYLRQILVQTMELISHEWTSPAHGFSRNFSTALAVEVEQRPNVDPQDLDVIQPLTPPQASINSEFPLQVVVRPGGVGINYHRHKYAVKDVEVLGIMLTDALRALLKSPHDAIGSITSTLLRPTTTNYLLSLGNAFEYNTRKESVQDNLVSLFEKTAAQYPQAYACQLGDEFMTYQELDQASNIVSNYLESHSLQGEVVCLQPSPSFNWLIGIYGILKSGAVYCPLDGNLPPAIRNDYFSISTSRTLLTTHESKETHCPATCLLLSNINNILSSSSSLPLDSNSRNTLPAESNAYLCFTSGSTGKPKGVLCTHQGLVAFQKDLEVRLFAAPGVRISQIMSPVFDGSIHEIFSALSYGATLVLNQPHSNPFAVLNSVDSAILTPSIAKVLQPADHPRLKHLYLVGEPVPQRVADTWAPHLKMYNMYGPTEGTCGATIKRLFPQQRVTLGKPNHSTRIYILDKMRKLCPPGVVGEICLAGVQIARAYIGRPEVTAQVFLQDPILPETNEHMYRTGDLGCWNADGELECLGRIDRQIKLQGFRLNLNDLETRVQRDVEEVDAIAIARKGDSLVAMAQAKKLSLDELRDKLSSVLPPYARPRQLATVDQLPMTTAGKVDYQAVVKDTTATAPSSPTSSSPLNKQKEQDSLLINLEKRLAMTWIEVLDLSPATNIGADSDFIQLGGSSIQQLSLSVQLSRELNCRIPLQVVIQNPILEDLAAAIRSTIQNGSKQTSSKVQGKTAISYMEREWCERYAAMDDTSAFNVSYACKIDRTIDRIRLAKSWNKILARYPILRSLYLFRNGDFTRRYNSQFPRARRVKVLDVRSQINRPFMISSELPIRVIISQKTMLVVASHIICDLTTIKLLLNEVASFYNGKTPPKSNKNYIRAPAWTAPVTTSSLDFWPQYLGEAAQTHGAIVQDGNSQPPAEGTSFVSKVSPELFSQMKDFIAETKFTYHQLALAAVAATLHSSDTTTTPDKLDMILGAPFMNRPTSEDMETIGLFLEPLPMRIQYPDNMTEDGGLESPISTRYPFMQSIKQSSQAALAHPVPWNQLLRRMGRTPDGTKQSLFDTMVTYLEQSQMPSSPLAGLHPLYTWAEGAKFKLMVEFQAVDNQTLMLRLEYDVEKYSKEEISLLQKRILGAVHGIVTGLPIEAITIDLRNIIAIQSDHQKPTEYFAHRLDQL